MIEMTVGHQHIFDFIEIDAHFPEIGDELVDMGLMQGVDQDDAIAGPDDPGGNPAHADIKYVVEGFQGSMYCALGSLSQRPRSGGIFPVRPKSSKRAVISGDGQPSKGWAGCAASGSRDAVASRAAKANNPVNLKKAGRGMIWLRERTDCGSSDLIEPDWGVKGKVKKPGISAGFFALSFLVLVLVLRLR